MNYPKPIQDLIQAQNTFDSVAYAALFTEDGAMFDEGNWHNGRPAIRQMIAHANEKYRSTMKPLSLEGPKDSPVLAAEVSGSFDGSPLVLRFHFELSNEQIRSLKVTG